MERKKDLEHEDDETLARQDSSYLPHLKLRPSNWRHLHMCEAEKIDGELEQLHTVLPEWLPEAIRDRPQFLQSNSEEDLKKLYHILAEQDVYDTKKEHVHVRIRLYLPVFFTKEMKPLDLDEIIDKAKESQESAEAAARQGDPKDIGALLRDSENLMALSNTFELASQGQELFLKRPDLLLPFCVHTPFHAASMLRRRLACILLPTLLSRTYIDLLLFTPKSHKTTSSPESAQLGAELADVFRTRAYHRMMSGESDVQNNLLLLTINFPSQMDIPETWMRASLYQREIYGRFKNITKPGFQLEFYACCIEAHAAGSGIPLEEIKASGKTLSLPTHLWYNMQCQGVHLEEPPIYMH